jgi:hypothetical protein
MPSDNALLYEPGTRIPVTAQMEIHWAAFDPAGNTVDGFGTYAPASAAPAPPTAAPTLGASTGGQGAVTLRWNMADTTGITGYGVQLLKGTTSGGTTTWANEGALREVGTDRILTVNGLTPGTYAFKVKAKNAGGYGPESAQSANLVVTTITDRVTVTRAQWRAGDFRIEGTSSAVLPPAGTATVHRVNADGSIGAAITGASANLVAAVAPATGSTFSIRVRNGAPTTNPGRVIVRTSFGGQSAVTTVANN